MVYHLQEGKIQEAAQVQLSAWTITTCTLSMFVFAIYIWFTH